mgnify:CR=1 FL=1
MKFAYKVVDIDEEGKFVSSSETGNRQKRYYRNLFVKRCKQFGPLCLFRTLKSARQYCSNMNGNDKFKIFKAEYIPAINETFYNGMGGRYSVDNVLQMFAPCFKGIPKEDFVLAESVKLLEERNKK